MYEQWIVICRDGLLVDAFMSSINWALVTIGLLILTLGILTED